MKRSFAFLLLICASVGNAQETTIRVLGVYASHQSPSSSLMSTQLQKVVETWNNSGLPGVSATTIQVLNNAVAIPVAYANPPSSLLATSAVAYQQSSIVNARNAYQADIVVLFLLHNTDCGATTTQWNAGNFVPNAQGLDLRYRNKWFVTVVNPNCGNWVGAHEFGHLLGGGHYATSQLYSDSRAWLTNVIVSYPACCVYLSIGTAIADPTDVSPPYNWSAGTLYYSRNATGSGDNNHENVRTLGITARSAANFFNYPSVPPVLYPPINLYGVNLGCASGGETRHDLFWSDDPATTASVTSYQIWKSQPVGQPFILGWTVYATYSPSYVAGATARARVKACSAGTCSAMSATHYDAVDTCNF